MPGWDDGTARVTAWESRRSPELIYEEPARHYAAAGFFYGRGPSGPVLGYLIAPHGVNLKAPFSLLGFVYFHEVSGSEGSNESNNADPARVLAHELCLSNRNSRQYLKREGRWKTIHSDLRL